ncbi:predicted protein [Uncinocarpus reesii 1704]|uniref:Killer toxin Kp4 domain-containing protein n=1 Tax=Uncinocarpus reesii (strain UAMH 1704) TaxID=336963 RepID=C4JU45_UNCRE|nr:uncharacterized protein UREG_05984 [Uncinocarpus reesii 1704]EEP81142.1 predicted protein [Uncinocarpus reesii 1704]
MAALAGTLAEAAPGSHKLPLFNGVKVVQASVDTSASPEFTGMTHALLSVVYVKARSFVKLTDSWAVLDSFSCKGSTLCGRGVSAADCGAAYRIIDRNHRYFTGSGATQTGVCYKKCGIFVEGGNCDLSGKEMIDGYNQLRSRGCKICGSKTYNDGCRLVINYVTGC